MIVKYLLGNAVLVQPISDTEVTGKYKLPTILQKSDDGGNTMFILDVHLSSLLNYGRIVGISVDIDPTRGLGKYLKVGDVVKLRNKINFEDVNLFATLVNKIYQIIPIEQLREDEKNGKISNSTTESSIIRDECIYAKMNLQDGLIRNAGDIEYIVDEDAFKNLISYYNENVVVEQKDVPNDADAVWTDESAEKSLLNNEEIYHPAIGNSELMSFKDKIAINK